MTTKYHPIYGNLKEVKEETCNGCVFFEKYECGTHERNRDFNCCDKGVIWMRAEDAPTVRYMTQTVYKFPNNWETTDKELADFVSENFDFLRDTAVAQATSFSTIVESHYKIASKYMNKG